MGAGGSPQSPGWALVLLASVPMGTGPSWSDHPEAHGAVAAGCSLHKPEDGRPPCLGSTHLRVGREQGHLRPDQSGAQRTSSEPRSPWRLQGQPVRQALHEPIPWVRPDSSVVSQLGGGGRDQHPSFLTGSLGWAACSWLPAAGPPWPRPAVVLPLELPLQGRLIWLAGGEGRGGGRGAQGLPGTRLPALPSPLLCPAEGGPGGQGGRASPTGLPCCLAPSSGREGEGAAGGGQARACH